MKAIKNKDKDCHNRTTRVGIKEIAAEAGVSPTTVSNVALGKTERISEKTVQRVQRLLEEKKYVPSMGNRLLSGKYSCVVGVMIGKNFKNAEAGEAALWIREVEKEIYRCGCYMLLHVAVSEEEILRLAMMWKMEGIILTGFEGKMEESVRSRCAIPVISAKIGNAVETELEAGELMGRYVLNYGHRSVCFMDDENAHAYWRGMKRAFQNEKAASVQVKYLQLPSDRDNRIDFYKKNLAREAFEEKLLVFANEYHAAEAMGYLGDMGILVPGEVSVASFGDDIFAPLMRPGLTVVKMNPLQSAVKTVEMLYALMRDETVNPGKERIELVLRDSVK